MYQYRVQGIVPPGGRYFYEVEATKFFVEAPTARGLQNILVDHYRANKLEYPDNMWALIQHYMCERMPEGFCTGGPGDKIAVRTFSLQQVRTKTRALAHATGNSEKVSLTEMKKRATICGACDKNDRSVCPTCVGLGSWALRLVGAEGNGIHEWLGVCAADGIALAAGVFVKNAPRDPKCAEDYSENCWRTHGT